ncbi:MAG: hypothetical protein A2984_02645 [Omnitrophica WOR_2 bacterium RIFCSPLOWO2_01_FULL_41_12]|nr:MAG: hypothetical protein A2984_02645 [Omnitrophica WOR_2 bacterium RIFCSPLOWO2_01_FULL_41_12]
MRKIIIFSLFILFLILSFALLIKKVYQEKIENDFLGESITYDVKFSRLSLGKAKFTYLMKDNLDGKPVNVITFETRVGRFTDQERIYCDPNNFLPLRVERNVSTWPTPEKITENYDQDNFTVAITKLKGNKKEESLIKKGGKIHNAILLPYHLRHNPKLNVGWTFIAELPTQQFKIELIAIEDVNVPAGTFKCYHFTSVPKKFEIWVTTDERRIPVKIKGMGNFGYILVMKEYKR